jgi:integrase/recombinase XerD
MSVSSTERPVSALRQRMLEDMAMRGLRSHTQHDYIRFVRGFAAFLGRSPDTATPEDIRRFQVYQHESGVQPPTINSSVSALRFFFTVTLDRPDLSRRLVLARYPRKLPAVLSVEEVGQLLEAAPGLKYKAILGTAYGAGLRVSEVASLKVDDIDSTRMLIRVEQGKGRKDRNAMLSPQLLTLLRLWWKEGKSRPGRSTARSTRPPKRPGSGSGSRRIRCATASPPICWNRMSISASSRSCWDTASSIRPPSMHRSRPRQSGR